MMKTAMLSNKKREGFVLKGKIQATIKVNFDVDSDDYPEDVNTIEEIAEFEKNNPDFERMVTDIFLEEDDHYFSVDPVVE